MTLIDFASIEALRASGFEGFRDVACLWKSMDELPGGGGVYLVVRIDVGPREFLERSVGGWFKGEDPTVSAADLSAKWVEASPVLYIGKAGSLSKRIDQYLKFGQGRAVGHRGGRYIWQLAGHERLQFCWKLTSDEPRAVERRLIADFDGRFRKLPFANLRH